MHFNFSEIENEFLKIILKSALEQKTRVFFVGGLIRDNIMGIESFDIDLLVLGDAIEFAKNLPCEIKLKSVHKDFSTVKVEYEGLSIDIASTRTEYYPFSGCLPIVDEVGVELINDVKRRDFSVNSIYTELFLIDNDLNFKTIDLVNGVDDIKTKTLRVLHDKSYIDDPTRIIRGLGFKYRFGFDFSEHDKKLIKEYLSDIQRQNASFDRIYSVFKKVLSNKNSFSIFREIVEKDYYKILFDSSLELDFKRVEELSKGLSKKSEVEFYLLLLENKPVLRAKISNSIEVYNHFSNFEDFKLAYYFYKTQDKNVLLYEKIKDIKLILKGRDLIELGYKEGKIFSEILTSLLSEKIKNPNLFLKLNDEINWVKNNYPII